MADPTYYQDILPLFTPLDIDCMRGRGVYLASYGYMKDEGNANEVLSMLQPDADPRMPYGGPYWSQDNLDLLQQWINTGRQEGTPPEGLPPDPQA